MNKSGNVTQIDNLLSAGNVTQIGNLLGAGIGNPGHRILYSKYNTFFYESPSAAWDSGKND